MPMAAGKPARERPLERTQRIKRPRPGAPLLETRARTILETMLEEVTDATEVDTVNG